MIKGYSFSVPCPPYDIDLIVSVMQTDVEFTRLLKRKINPSYHSAIPKSYVGEIACFVKFENGQAAIRFKENPDLNTLTHEVFHAVYGLFDRLGINLTKDSEEAFAYFTGYLNQEIYNRLK
jgi:hypothetical protein